MMNSNYKNEIASAHQFLIDHYDDNDLKHFLTQMEVNSNLYSYREKWLIIYDWMQEHYPEVVIGSLITGLVYYCES